MTKLIKVSCCYNPDIDYRTGNLTAKQYAALRKIAHFSPSDYIFEVVRCPEWHRHSKSTATLIKIWKKYDGDDYVALVGEDGAYHYDGSKTTGQIAKRVLHLVYHK